MSLSAGHRVGTYEVIAPLGAGGMGEVYRARDTALHREVAIKILPDAVAGDPERIARFRREAQVLASLNHPHIAQIYGLEESAQSTGSGHAAAMLIMELVPGEDLSTRLARGAIPVDEALAVARQVADALDAAHSSGIVHRDLKPANVKVRPDGTVKVLDFGLAKALDGTDGSGTAVGSDVHHSPTITSPATTRAGIILGTAAYMSPEQARGKPIDKRADIWAFGCLLYELLTGRAAFEGETITDVLGAIVKSEPDWTRLPAATPPGVHTLLRRCLQKDAGKRLRDIGDAIVELLPDSSLPSQLPVALPGGQRAHRGFIALAWIASLAIVGAGAAASTYYFARPAREPRLQKFSLAIQEDGTTIREPVISPDGRQVAYIGRSRIWVQGIDEWKPRELAGTEAAVRPFWSPNGDWIAYFRSETLLKVPVSGGPVVRIAALPAVQAALSSNSGVWADDGMITVSLASGPLLKVPSGGGVVKESPVKQPADVLDLHDIEPLPGGALLTAVHRTTGFDAIGVVKDGSLRILLEATSVRQPAYAVPGHVIFERRAPNAGLWAVAFSIDRLELTGEPFLIGPGTEPTMARDGTLLFLGEPEQLARQLSWFSMLGQPGTRLGEPREWIEGVAISHDSRQVLASAIDGLWTYDVETGARSRVTNGQTDVTPDWVDKDTIVFVRTLEGEPVVMLKRLNAVGEREIARRARFPHTTEDGRRLVFNQRLADRYIWEIAWVDLDRPGEIHRLGPAHTGGRFPTVSPDGTLVAYVSGELGRDEIFLTQLPSGEGKWQLSTEGGGWTLFSPRGDAVYYRAPDGAFMSVAVSTQGGVKIGHPKKLFDWGNGWMLFYDLARDGQRGVAAVPSGRANTVPRLSVVQNWHAEFSNR